MRDTFNFSVYSFQKFTTFGCMWSSLTMIFNGFGILLLLQFIRYKIKDYQREKIKSRFWTIKRHKYIVTVGAVLLFSLFAVEFILPDISSLKDEGYRMLFSKFLGIGVAFGISAIWAVYLRKLDVFEREKWIHIIIVFLMGCVSSFLVFPISGFIKNYLQFRLNGEPINDFAYCVIGIGMVEELVKMIPLIIIVRFHKIVNEPYDFLLYASISALGFAFVENSLYIQNSSFFAINGRALMSTVAHMTFSSVIGYAFMIASCRRPGNGWYVILGGFLLASGMHGFFDFWLINPIAKNLNGLSYLFFILTTHFWFTLKSKAINASYFFDDKIKLVNDSLRYFIIFWMLALLMLSIVLIGIFHGSQIANSFLRDQLFAYGFLMYYLSFRFSKFVIAPKAIAACQVAFERVIPEEPAPKENWETFYEEKRW
jgi:RsiW-degrading membrane proteinase PrsW (M82 family)